MEAMTLEMPQLSMEKSMPVADSAIIAVIVVEQTVATIVSITINSLELELNIGFIEIEGAQFSWTFLSSLLFF